MNFGVWSLKTKSEIFGSGDQERLLLDGWGAGWKALAACHYYIRKPLGMDPIAFPELSQYRKTDRGDGYRKAAFTNGNEITEMSLLRRLEILEDTMRRQGGIRI
jgi:hypothetical protein